MMAYVRKIARKLRNLYLRLRGTGVSQLRIEIQRAILNPYINYKIDRYKSNNDGEYSNQSKTSAIVQFFNSRRMVRPIINSLRQSEFAEIIIIDDGSIDGSSKDWRNILTKPNEFVIFSNDLYEVRTYQRALQMTNAEYVCLLQDDDIPPSNSEWVSDAIELFDYFQDLVILGGRTAISPRIPDNPYKTKNTSYQVDGGMAGKPGVNKYKRILEPKHKHKNIDFMFVPVINRAPMWVRRDTFIDMGGIDQAFAPYQCDDVDSCLSALSKGYKVGLYNPNFNRIAEGGMSAYNPMSERSEIIKNSWDIIYKRYGHNIFEDKYNTICENANESLRTQ
jgi:GT2 family glycosyltransferase